MTLLRLLPAAFAGALLCAADESPSYTMTNYVLGLLRKGPNWGAGDKQENARIQEGHMANIRRMAAAGKLAVAGPLSDNGDIRGIFIFKTTTMDEAKALVANDPAVKSGHLVLELHPWYAAAGLRVSPPKGFTEENDVEFARPGGRSMTLDLRIPESAAPVPAVVIVHGGGFVRGDKRTFVTPLFDPLSMAGFGWFSINYRMAPEFQLAQAAEDVSNAIRWVRANAAKYHVDPNRIALAGESAGGFMVAYAGVKAQGDTRVAAVVDFYGPHDLVAHTEKRRAEPADPAKPESPGLREFLGLKSWSQPDAVDRLRAASPTSYVHKGMPPFLFVHGTADTQVAYEQSPRMCELMKKAGAGCEIVTVERGRHGMGSWDADPAMGHWRTDVIGWLKKTLR
jgi:alpha-L-fucosidase 2